VITTGAIAIVALARVPAAIIAITTAILRAAPATIATTAATLGAFSTLLGHHHIRRGEQEALTPIFKVAKGIRASVLPQITQHAQEGGASLIRAAVAGGVSARKELHHRRAGGIHHLNWVVHHFAYKAGDE